MFQSIIFYIIEAILNRMAKVVGKEVQKSSDRDLIKKDAEESLKPLVEAQSAEEIGKASKDALNGL